MVFNDEFNGDLENVFSLLEDSQITPSGLNTMFTTDYNLEGTFNETTQTKWLFKEPVKFKIPTTLTWSLVSPQRRFKVKWSNK